MARNGPEFESRIKINEATNPKFNFLNPNDPYHPYYLHKIREFIEGRAKEATAQPPAPGAVAAPATGDQNAAPAATPAPEKEKERTLGFGFERRKRMTAASFQELVAPKEKPAEFEFIAEPPSISALDMYRFCSYSICCVILKVYVCLLWSRIVKFLNSLHNLPPVMASNFLFNWLNEKNAIHSSTSYVLLIRCSHTFRN